MLLVREPHSGRVEGVYASLPGDSVSPASTRFLTKPFACRMCGRVAMAWDGTLVERRDTVFRLYTCANCGYRRKWRNA